MAQNLLAWLVYTEEVSKSSLWCTVRHQASHLLGVLRVGILGWKERRPRGYDNYV